MPRVFRVWSVIWIVLMAAAPAAGGQSMFDFDVQAHRGGRGGGAEGSLRAFAESLQIGVSTLELDVTLTRDSQPVVWHDQTIGPDRCIDTAPVFRADPQYPYVGKPVHDLTLAQLSTLDCGDPIATLPEVLTLTDSYRASDGAPGAPGVSVRYSIETKVDPENPRICAGPQEFVDVTLAAVRAAGRVGAVEIQSFDWRILPMVRRAEPAIPLVALYDRITWSPGSRWLAGIDPVAVGDPVTGATMVGADILAPYHALVDRGLVERAHALGLKVIPWTINDAATMRAQIALDVDGIITDYPVLLRSVLADLGMLLPPSYHRA